MDLRSIKNIKIRKQKGVFVFEAIVAIFIFVVGILGVVKIQSSTITAVSESGYRTSATYLADSIIGKMWLDMKNIENYDVDSSTLSPAVDAWKLEVANLLPGVVDDPDNPSDVPALPTIDVANNGGRYNVTVSIFWRHPGSEANSRHVVQTVIAPP